MNVLFGTSFGSQKAILEKFNGENSHNINLISPDDYSEQTLLKYAPETDVLITDSISKEFLNQAPHLKYIQIPYTGANGLDFNLLKNYPSVTVTNSHSNSLTIAEHAVALLFTVAKQINYRDAHMRQGDWSTRYERVMNSFPLVGKTAGIIGYGAIGEKTAKMLKFGFDMKILGIKRHPEEIKDNICDFLGGIEDMPKVLQESDFIIVALPLTNETRGIINKEQFDMMKKGAIIVNIARGPIIEEKALYDFLKSKKGYAGIDVWYNYPSSETDITQGKDKKTFQNYPFHELENIVMSPHSAFRVADIGVKTGEDIITNLMLLSEGKQPINILHSDLGY